MLGRIDIHIVVPRVDYEKLSRDRLGESSLSIREQVQTTMERQHVRFERMDIVSNSDMRVKEVRQFCKLDVQGDSLMRSAMSQLQLSARGYHRVLKLARTIADLAGSDAIQPPHLTRRCGIVRS
jgi:magnesium chelatase family protein